MEHCATVAGVDVRELARKAELAELLLHVARELVETNDPERVYDRFHELLADVIPHDGVVVSSYDEADGLLRCEYAWADGERLDATIFPPLPLNREGGGMQSRVIVSGEVLVVNDVREAGQGHRPYYQVDSSRRTTGSASSCTRSTASRASRRSAMTGWRTSRQARSSTSTSPPAAASSGRRARTPPNEKAPFPAPSPVERAGFEPATFGLQSRRSPN